MVRRFAEFSVVLVLVAAAGTSAVAQSGRPTWSARGMFVLGDIILDFQQHREMQFNLHLSRQGMRQANLENCSSPQLFCASGEMFRVVFPRACVPMRAGDRWEQEGVVTEVLGAEQEDGTTWHIWLAEPRNPPLIFDYNPERGIVQVLETDAAGSLVEAARAGRLRARMRNYRGRGFHELRTLDSMGRCT